MTSESGQAVVIAGGFKAATVDDAEVATSDIFDLQDFENLPARDVPVGALSGGLQLRQGGTTAAHVQLLIDAAGTAELPPILVQEDGFRIIDGLHRLEAAKLRGDHVIKARLLDCTDSEALVLAMEANSAHGLPLSKADRVSGATRVLTAHPDWSDRAIAGITGLSAKTIASLRNRSVDPALLAGKRLGRDGRRRPVTAGEGRRRAAEYILANPSAPLREVAREADVSLGTVHDVSSRLRRGDSPERNGLRAPANRPIMHPMHAGASPVALAPGSAATPLRRKTHTEGPVSWAEVAANVAKDPTIRYTDSGKRFLRWMGMHASDPDGWREFVNSVPVHWLSVLAPIADATAKEWTMFAERLRQAGSGAIGA
ncbi:MAG: ParB N-terminal domain-containing protein [Thermocrispum sp.]